MSITTKQPLNSKRICPVDKGWLFHKASMGSYYGTCLWEHGKGGAYGINTVEPVYKLKVSHRRAAKAPKTLRIHRDSPES